MPYKAREVLARQFRQQPRGVDVLCRALLEVEAQVLINLLLHGSPLPERAKL